LFWLQLKEITSARANLKNYNSVSDLKIKEAWAEGLTMARRRAESVGMVSTLQTADKWAAPWPASLSDLESLAEELITDADLDQLENATLTPQSQQVSTQSTTFPSLSASLDAPNVASSSTSNSNVDLACKEATVIWSSIFEAFQEAGDIDTGADDASTRRKASPTVEVPGKGLVYKMRLITELNLNSQHLSLDCLRKGLDLLAAGY
jgi:hypothetical protein